MAGGEYCVCILNTGEREFFLTEGKEPLESRGRKKTG